MKQCIITLQSLEIEVFLGWLETERSKKQKIAIDVELQFSAPPLACMSDDLQDTICYDDLIAKIKNYLAGRQFRLLEFLGREIFQVVKKEVPEDVRVEIKLKKKPSIEGLSGGVVMTCKD